MNPQVRVSAHLFFLFVNATCLMELLGSSPSPRAVYRKITFLTNYNQIWVVLAYLLVLKDDIQLIRHRILDYSLNVKRLVRFLTFQAAIIAFAFWPVYLYDKNLVFSPKSQTIIPEHLVLMLHGGNFLALQPLLHNLIPSSAFDCLKLIDTDVTPHNEAFTYALIYGLLTASNYILFGRFVYPFQKYIPNLINAILTAGFIYGIHLAYKVFCQTIEKHRKGKSE